MSRSNRNRSRNRKSNNGRVGFLVPADPRPRKVVVDRRVVYCVYLLVAAVGGLLFRAADQRDAALQQVEELRARLGVAEALVAETKADSFRSGVGDWKAGDKTPAEVFREEQKAAGSTNGWIKPDTIEDSIVYGVINFETSDGRCWDVEMLTDDRGEHFYSTPVETY